MYNNYSLRQILFIFVIKKQTKICMKEIKNEILYRIGRDLYYELDNEFNEFNDELYRELKFELDMELRWQLRWELKNNLEKI
jgi:hypothetical protein